MRILALDIGGLTQDILLFDTTQVIENCVKMIMPSPTSILAGKIRAATRARRAVFFSGVNAGGGPSKRALADHLKSGLMAYATPEAATTFDDDLEEVARWGVIIVPENKVPEGKEIERIETKDLDLAAVEKALKAFEVETRLDAVAVAVLDHGEAPPGMSDRRFRFHCLRQMVEERKGLIAFAYLAKEIPPHLTRMKAVARSLGRDLPLLLLDTPVAAAIGAGEDREVARHSHRVMVNVGNFHTLAFHLQQDLIMGFFEHHTGFLDREKIDNLIVKLVKGELTNEEVYNDHGHGCLIIERSSEVPFVTVTGPRRNLMAGSKLNPYCAVPYGDMMLTGCFGLVRAFAQRVEMWREDIENSLRGH
jgi:uncharacterized protein (DUF1786 family)